MGGVHEPVKIFVYSYLKIYQVILELEPIKMYRLVYEMFNAEVALNDFS